MMQIDAQDFEYLFETAMEWDLATWKDQESRFDFIKQVDKGHIYWVENYASFILCREFLITHGHLFNPSFDEALDQWCFISDYDFHAARVSA
jgi:hypothetical protein